MPRRLTDCAFALLLVLAAIAPAAAQEIPRITLQPGEAVDLVARGAAFDGDPADAADPRFPKAVRDAARQAPPAKPPWPDYQIRWLAVELHNPAGAAASQWMLRMDTDPLYLPQMILLQDSRVVAEDRRETARAVQPDTGATLAVGQRFPFSIPPGESRILLLRVMALGFGSLVADVVTHEAWLEWATRRQAMIAFAIALIAATGLYTVVIGAGLRRPAYFWYGLHILVILGFWVNIYGIPADLFGFTDDDRIVYKLAVTLAVAVAPMLTRALLEVPRFSPWLDRALLLTGLTGFAMAVPVIALMPWPELHRAWVRGPDWQYLLALVSYVLMIMAGIAALRQIGAAAAYYLAGWVPYIGSVVLTLAAYYGLVPFTGDILLASFLLVCWEALMLAQALGTRIRTLYKEKVTAEAQRKAQQDFVASISHDLRTPLNAILGAAAMTEDRNLPEAVRQRLGTIRRAGKILLALISDLLDRASISSGSLTISPRPLPLRDCIQDAVGLVRERAEEKGLRLRLNFDSALPGWIEADELRLKQILFNLAENAVKYTAQGEVAVAVAKDGSGQLEVIVSDTGPGIPADERDAIFLAYRRGRAGEAPDQNAGSRGLGLSIARDLARAMEGDITVESAPGEGSRFRLRLPLLEAAPVSRSLVSHVVLLVDDQALNREIGTALLRSDGHVVRSCIATEALAQIGRETPDIVLLDLQMPELDGNELARRIRGLPDERKANLPIVVLTAAADGEARRRLAGIGVFDILLKPVTMEALRPALQQAVGDGPVRVNYALQTRLVGEIGGGNWVTALERFREASRDLLRDAAEALPAQRAELLHRFAGMAGALGLDAVSRQAAALEVQQRDGESVLDALPALRDLWSRSLERCLNPGLQQAQYSRVR